MGLENLGKYGSKLTSLVKDKCNYFRKSSSKPISYKKKGFTLTELLVTISSIGLLTGLLLPSLQRGRREAKAVICMTKLHNWSNELNVEDFYAGRRWWAPYFDKNFRRPDCNDILLCPIASKRKENYPPKLARSNNEGSKNSAWLLHNPKVIGSYGLNSYLARVVLDSPVKKSMDLTYRKFWSIFGAFVIISIILLTVFFILLVLISFHPMKVYDYLSQNVEKSPSYYRYDKYH